MVVSYIQALLMLGIIGTSLCQNQNNGELNQNIYQFLKKTQLTSTFIGVIERSSQAAKDTTVLTALGYGTNGKVLPTDNSGNRNGFTVFAPVNDALTQLPSNADHLRNDMNNLVMKGRITLEMLKQQKDGKNITSAETFGFMPRLRLRTVANFYNRQLVQTANTQNRKKRQLQQQQQQNSSMSSTNLYEQYEELYGQKQAYQGPPISPKLPQDELYLLNSAIILDKFELSNGIVYLIDTYPQYYDKSLYTLSKDNSISGLGQNINFWINKADQSYNKGDENLKNALNAYGPNTFFLPTDASFNKFTDRNLLNNDSFLVDTVLKSHRISNQILYDYYLDDPSVTYMTDGKLPVSTKHRYVGNQLEIEVSIGHVKGKILPGFRNIYCASGVIHLIDTVLGIPTDSAYKKISENQKLSTFKQLIDASQTYKTLLAKSPISSNPQQSTSSKQMTILAPNDMGLLAIKDDLLKNSSALEDFLGAHIITDGSNKIFFTDHDESIFTNGRQYSTMSPGTTLTTQVGLDPDGVSNSVVFSMQANPSVKAKIVDGNDLVSNGVIHIIDKPLTLFTSSDIAGLLEKYSSMNSPDQPAFSQFVDALRSTGIFNDLKTPSKQYTLFIPTNEALAQYQDIMKGNDEEKKKQLIYRHICIDQNLQSKNLASNNSNSMQTQEKTLMCRNALGQDLTLTKDGYDLISKWQGKASSKIINDFPGVYSSAYVLDTPLLNHNLPNLGLHKYNAASRPTQTITLLLLVASLVSCTLL